MGRRTLGDDQHPSTITHHLGDSNLQVQYNHQTLPTPVLSEAWALVT